MCFNFPGKVLKVLDDGLKAKVEPTNKCDCKAVIVDSSLLENLSPGDYVMVHQKLAIQKLTEKEAQEILTVLEEIHEKSHRS